MLRILIYIIFLKSLKTYVFINFLIFVNLVIYGDF
jgi:hypothetical protein